MGMVPFMNGYLKIINPDEFSSLVNDSYLRSEGLTYPVLSCND